MKALVYQGYGQHTLQDRPKPAIERPEDAIVRITKTTICTTDLHILKGEIPSVAEGRILGHEGVGVVEQVGTAVSNFKVGDHVLISCITSCGNCANCKKGLYSHCEHGGWILGNLIDGTNAEYVRIPFADHSLYPLPAGADDEMFVLLSDVMPTGLECGVLNGQVQPGDTVAIIGAGPVGLAALLTAQFYAPAEIIVVDNDDARLKLAKILGATQVFSNGLGNAAEKIMTLTHNRGVDVAIEAIGLPAGFDICQAIVSVGGHIANIGAHGHPVRLNLDKLWSQNITLSTGLVDTKTIPMLTKMVASGKLQTQALISHHFLFDQWTDAYETFGNAIESQSLKVIITNGVQLNPSVEASEDVDNLVQQQPISAGVVNDSLGG